MKCDGAILAGGNSSRMGVDKAELRLSGKTLLQRAQQILLQAGIDNIYISRSDAIADKIPKRGPVSGIHALLDYLLTREKVQDRYLVIVPVDMPCLAPELIAKLKTARAAALVFYAGHKMPFRLRVDKQMFALLDKLLCAGKNLSLGKFQDFIADKIILELTEAEQAAFHNINTQEEWHALTQANHDIC